MTNLLAVALSHVMNNTDNKILAASIIRNFCTKKKTQD